jgi:hypothetical protein
MCVSGINREGGSVCAGRLREEGSETIERFGSRYGGGEETMVGALGAEGEGGAAWLHSKSESAAVAWERAIAIANVITIRFDSREQPGAWYSVSNYLAARASAIAV